MRLRLLTPTALALLATAACSDSRVQSVDDDDVADDDDAGDDDDAADDDDAVDDDDVAQNQPPVIVIVAPTAQDALFSDVAVTLEAQVFDPEDPYDALRVAWTVDGAGVADGLVPDAQGRTLTEVTLTQGTHRLVVTALDSEGASGAAEVEVDVGGPRDSGPCDTVPTYALPTCQEPTGIYFSDIQNGLIHRMDPDGSNVTVVHTRVADDLEVDLDGSMLYWVHGDAIIERGPLSGASWEVVHAALPYAYGIAIDPFARHLYWTNQVGTPKIQRSCLWGGDIVDVVPGLGLGGNCCAIGLDIDFVNERLHWMDGYYGGPVTRANLDGTGMTSLRSTPGIGNGVAIDHRGGKVYWTEYGNSGGQDTINRSNLDGSGFEQLLNSSDGLDTPQHLAVDPEGGKIYWADLRGAAKVGRANLDGSGVENLYSGPGEVRAIALERASPCQ